MNLAHNPTGRERWVYKVTYHVFKKNQLQKSSKVASIVSFFPPSINDHNIAFLISFIHSGTMHASNSFTQIFLKHMLLGLQNGVASKNMSFLKRKRAIKLTADIAMACAKDGAKWSHALIMNLSKKSKNKTLLRTILGSEYERLTKPRLSWKMRRAKKILQRSFKVQSRIKEARQLRGINATSAHAGAVVTRTKVLKRLVPGGEYLDDSSLLEETLDYVISLRTQVDLMHLLVKALGVPNLK